MHTHTTPHNGKEISDTTNNDIYTHTYIHTQPRVMDRESIKRQKAKLSDWMEKVQTTSTVLSSEAPEILG